MKKGILLSVLVSAAFTNSAFSQAIITKTYGKVQIKVNSPGPLFNNMSNSTAAFEAPAGSGVRSIFAGNIWIGAKTPQGTALAAEMFGDALEFQNGPINTTYDAAYKDKYDRIWAITKQEILFHKANYNKPGYQMPASISSWPANTYNGNNIGRAPFIDVDGDNAYKPELGDYPVIKGDQGMFFFKNDVAPGSKKFTSSQSMGLEIMVMVYAYNKTNQNPELENTIFVSYLIVNKGNKIFTDVRLGAWTDFDLGNPMDDYIGTFVDENAVYIYNADENDDVSSGPSPGYGSNPPAQAVVILSENLSSTYSGTYQDFTAQNVYKLLNGQNAEGMVRPEPFIFSGDPVSGTGLSERTYQNPGGDRQALASVHNADLLPGGFACFDVAYVWSRESSGGVNASLTKLKSDIAKVRQQYLSSSDNCNNFAMGIGSSEKHVAIDIYPNPTNDLLTISGVEVSSITVKNTIGQTILSKTENTVSLKDISAGIYLIEVTTTKGEIISKQIVKQ